MKEIRCLFCKRLLCKIEGEYRIEIKCSKCKQINNITECQKEHQSS